MYLLLIVCYNYKTGFSLPRGVPIEEDLSCLHLPYRNAQRTHATSPRMVKAPIGHPPHMAGTSPLEEPPGYYAENEPLAWSQ